MRLYPNTTLPPFGRRLRGACYPRTWRSTRVSYSGLSTLLLHFRPNVHRYGIFWIALGAVYTSHFVATSAVMIMDMRTSEAALNCRARMSFYI